MVSGRSKTWILAASLLLAACEAAEDVRVQPLPPLQRLSAEARAGLPEVAGVWRFAGWEFAEGDSASLARDDLPGLGQLWLQTQRLDSVGGAYVTPGGRVPLLGEVRRDSIVSLVALAGGGEGYYLAGRYSADTLWIGLTSLVEPGTWPAEARAAFVRSEVASPFVRLQGAPPPQLAAADTLADTTSVPAAAGAAPLPAGADTLTGRPPAPGTGAAVAVPRPPAGAPPAQTRPQQQPPPRTAQPQPQPQPEPRTEEPEPEVEVEVPPPPELPPLLGEPVEPDTIIPR